MGDRSYLANGVTHIAKLYLLKTIDTMILIKKNKIRVVLFENMWVENWEFRWDFGIL